MMPADTYIVINKTTLHDSDRKILIMLYQPIIGSTAINFYMTLWSYLDKYEIISIPWTHHHLMSSMQVSLENIIEAREKLEAIGLLKTYVKIDTKNELNNYVYELYSPLRVYDFLTDPILSTILHDSIGELEYRKVIEYFKIPSFDLGGYKDISSKFNDIFMTTSIINTEEVTEIKKTNRLGIAYEPTIDLNNVFSLIPSEMLNTRTITKQIKELLYKLALVYNYDNDQMREIVLASINDMHRIDIDILKTNARKYYKFENGNKLTGLVYKNQPEYLRSKTTSVSKKAKMIYTFETTSPYEFLSSKNGCELTKAETDILNYLLVDANMKPGVVNVLLDYILNTSDNKLIKSFVENKATEWKRNNIETVEDAMEMAKKDKTNRKPKKVVELSKPVWFDKNNTSEQASADEQKAFLEKLKNME